MTIQIQPLDINEDKWIDLIQRSNEVINAFTQSVLSKSFPTTGDIHLEGTIKATKIYENSKELVHSNRKITAGTGLVGGGYLVDNITFSLSANTHASLALANTALQSNSINNLVPKSRTILSTNTGMSGGGSLANDITFELTANTHASLALANTALQPGIASSSWKIGDVNRTISVPSDDNTWLICDESEYLNTDYPELEGLMLNAPIYHDQWDISTAVYSSKSFLVSSQDSQALGIFFKPDGTKMYMVGITNDRVFEYNLSTAWDITTASYSSKSFLVNAQDTAPLKIFFKPDGTKMYISGLTNTRIYEYNLSTAWDITTASYSSKSFSVFGQDSNPYGIFFKPDGTKMYMVGITYYRVHEYNLSTAWDISTAVYSTKFISVSGQDTSPFSIFFKLDGTKMYMLGRSNNRVFEYNLSTAWDISSAVYSSKFISVSGQDTSPSVIYFKSDGTKMYMLGSSNRVFEYNIGTTSESNTHFITPYLNNDIFTNYIKAKSI